MRLRIGYLAGIVALMDELSRYVHSIDPNHLISVGDEGFYCTPGAADWTENCSQGVDTLAFTRLKYIDVMSLHLYPDHWSQDPAWGVAWIHRHVADAKANEKAVMLGEFGLLDTNRRNLVFQQWTDAFHQAGGDGALYWILSDVQDDGSLYPDYDGFTVYCPSPVCTMMSNFAALHAREGYAFPPVADHDSAVTEYNTPVTLTPAANDIAYNRAKVVAAQVDLAPSMAGQQTSVITAEGGFALQPDGTVRYTPADGFVGAATVSYTIRDSYGRSSNVATVRVTVQPDPTAAQMEDG
ncbi:MAG: Ig-like domain-containing protein [Chloroflexales bacterium]|nr:Ig-like domain-containing protein [Chloroflexales bacterium]